MIRIVLGIIAGKRGGIAGISLYTGEDFGAVPYWCQPMPTKCSNDIDAEAIKYVYRSAIELGSTSHSPSHVLVAIQKAWPPSGGDLIATSRYTYDAGIVEGIALGMGLMIEHVSYACWRRHYPKMTYHKRARRAEMQWAAVNQAGRLFPALPLGVDCNNSMAEALLLANFAAKELV